MKIIHFISNIDKSSGGVTAYLQLLVGQQRKYTEIVVAAGISSSPVVMDGARVVLFDTSVKRYFSLRKEFEQFLADEKPDLVHVNGIWDPQIWWFQREAIRLKITVVLSPHGMMEPWILNRNRWKKKIALALYQHKAMKLSKHLHATAESEKENLIRLGYKQPITVIANGIEIQDTELKKDWTPRRNLLFLSRIHPKKGIEHLIEAVSELKEEFKGGQVVIAGEGDENYLFQLSQKVKEEGLSDIIRFTGGVYGDEKWKFFRKADLFVLPTYSENFGIVVVEALACGTPVITTQGAPWKELEERKCGWWTEIGTQPLVNALKQYLAMDADQLEQMGKRGSELVIEKYSSDTMASDMQELYKKCLNQTN